MWISGWEVFLEGIDYNVLNCPENAIHRDAQLEVRGNPKGESVSVFNNPNRSTIWKLSARLSVCFRDFLWQTEAFNEIQHFYYVDVDGSVNYIAMAQSL